MRSCGTQIFRALMTAIRKMYRTIAFTLAGIVSYRRTHNDLIRIDFIGFFFVWHFCLAANAYSK